MCTISLALMGLSAGIGAMGSISSANAQAAAHKANAANYEAQAKLRTEKAEFDARESERKFERQQGSTLARIGATGIDAASFSDILADDAAEAALERSAIRYSGRQESNQLQFQASSQRAQASAARTAGFFNAASSVVSAFAPLGKTTGSGIGSTGVSIGSNWQYNWATTYARA